MLPLIECYFHVDINSPSIAQITKVCEFFLSDSFRLCIDFIRVRPLPSFKKSNFVQPYTPVKGNYFLRLMYVKKHSCTKQPSCMLLY